MVDGTAAEDWKPLLPWLNELDHAPTKNGKAGSPILLRDDLHIVRRHHVASWPPCNAIGDLLPAYGFVDVEKTRGNWRIASFEIHDRHETSSFVSSPARATRVS